MRVFDENKIRRLRMFEKKIAGNVRVFGSKREEVTEGSVRVFGSKREEVTEGSVQVFGSKREEVTEGSRIRQMRNFAKCTFVPKARLLECL
jgi:hypothetical protein